MRVPARFKHRLVPHALAALCTLAVMTYDFSHERQITIFSFHPIFMSVAFALCLPEGLMVYRNKVLFDILSPIMAHGSRTKIRTIHLTLQMVAGACIALGFLFVVANKAAHRRWLLPRTWHGFLGLLIMLLVGVQIAVGRLKLNLLTQGVVDSRSSSSRQYEWHGLLGRLIFDVSVVGLVSGVFTWVGLTFRSIFLVCMILALWVSVGLQMEIDQEKSQQKQEDAAESGADGAAVTDTLVGGASRRPASPTAV